MNEEGRRGLSMRNVSVSALCAAALLIVAVPALADQQPPFQNAFQIFGGMSDEPGNDVWEPQAVPQDLRHRTVDFATSHPPGTIIVRTHERRLYYVLPDGKAVMYFVGVGREGFAWSGTNKVSRKAEWPAWRPPQEMIEREADRGHFLPDYVAGGPGNPLGARAIYIGDTQFRIHGTSQPWSIGRAVSSGCIRLLNEEVIDLYNRVEIGATVVVE